jgi:hypothetical protein
VLAVLCHHIVDEARLARLIFSYCRKKDRVDVSIYLDLLNQRAVESDFILKYSRSCRLTHQSTKNKNSTVLKQRMVDAQVYVQDEKW